MAGTTTTYVLVGEHSTGPFGVRAWKPRHGVALIEKHRPCWVADSIAHGGDVSHEPGAVYLPGGWNAAHELIVVVAARCVRQPGYLDLLREHGVPELRVAEPALDGPPLPRDLVDAAVASVRDSARLGVVRLDETSWFGDDDLLWLRGVGLDVDDFRLNAVPGSR